MTNNDNKAEKETPEEDSSPEPDVLLNIPEEKRNDYIAIDCEMAGSYSNESVLIRATLIDGHGKVILDEYCQPTSSIYEMRAWCHGIFEKDLIGKQSDTELIKKIQEIIKDKIIIGHALKFDFEVLKFTHPANKIRDTAEQFSWTCGKQTPSLKELAEKKLGMEIQTDTHDSKEDALAALKIFAKEYESWENGRSPEYHIPLIRKRKLLEEQKLESSFYCKSCNIASNSKEQHAQHITGKKHAKKARLF